MVDRPHLLLSTTIAKATTTKDNNGDKPIDCGLPLVDCRLYQRLVAQAPSFDKFLLMTMAINRTGGTVKSDHSLLWSTSPWSNLTTSGASFTMVAM
jgi:hypothetical protein